MINPAMNEIVLRYSLNRRKRTGVSPYFKSLKGIIRFLFQINPDDNGCWIFIGNQKSDRYPSISFQGKKIQAHRFMYELNVGPIPDGYELMHSCDVKRCVNPMHLVPGTHLQNMEDAARRGLYRSRFSQDQIREIRRMGLDGIPQRIIAKKFLTSHQYVSKIISRKAHRTVG